MRGRHCPFFILHNMENTQIWEKHFGNSITVPFDRTVEPFMNELCDNIEKQLCNSIKEKIKLNTASENEVERMKLVQESYFKRNGKQL